MENLLKLLTEAFGPSGEESEVAALIEQKIRGAVDHLYTDKLGNLVAVRQGPSPRIVISAHMDEIGVIITHIDDQGFARLAPVGGVLPHQLVGQRVRLKQGRVGVVYHEKIKNLKELDWPVSTLIWGRKQVEEIRIGDLAVLEQPFVNAGGRFLAKAMDNRAGCAVLIEALRRLPRRFPRSSVLYSRSRKRWVCEGPALPPIILSRISAWR